MYTDVYTLSTATGEESKNPEDEVEKWPSEEVREGEEKEDEREDARAANLVLKASHTAGETPRERAAEHREAVQGREGDEIETAEEEVYKCDRRREGERRFVQANCRTKAHQETENDRE